MTVIFTVEERKWIDMKPFAWTVKNGCPEDIKKSIERKLTLLKVVR